MVIEPVFDNRFTDTSYGFRPGRGCKEALRRVEDLLKAGVMEGTNWQEGKNESTPQGGVVSPLLADVCLDPLGWLTGEPGFEMVRYLADVIVLCRGEAEAQEALGNLMA